MQKINLINPRSLTTSRDLISRQRFVIVAVV